MRKNAMILCCYVCVTAAFGAFFRWIQNMTAFETGTGLYTAGSLWTKVMVLVCAAAIAGAFGLLWGLQRFSYFPTKNCEDTFKGTTPLAPYVVIAISALSVLGGVVLYVTAGGESNSFLLRLLAFFFVCSGLSFYHVMSVGTRKRESAMLCLCAAVLVWTASFWLVVSYKLHSTQPSAWTYGVEILAIGMDALALYYLAGYAFGRVQTYRSLFFGMVGAFLSLVALADDRMVGMQLEFAAVAAMLIYSNWMIMANMRTEPIPEQGEDSGNQIPEQ